MSDESLSNEDVVDLLIAFARSNPLWADEQPKAAEAEARAAVLSRMSSPSHERAMAEGGWKEGIEAAAKLVESFGDLAAYPRLLAPAFGRAIVPLDDILAKAIRGLAPPTPTTKEETA